MGTCFQGLSRTRGHSGSTDISIFHVRGAQNEFNLEPLLNMHRIVAIGAQIIVITYQQNGLTD